MTLSDLEWPLHASCAISAVAELLVLDRQIKCEHHNEHNATYTKKAMMLNCWCTPSVGSFEFSATAET